MHIFFFLLLHSCNIAFYISCWSLCPFDPLQQPFCSLVSDFCHQYTFVDSSFLIPFLLSCMCLNHGNVLDSMSFWFIAFCSLYFFCNHNCCCIDKVLCVRFRSSLLLVLLLLLLLLLCCTFRDILMFIYKHSNVMINIGTQRS